MGNLGRSLVVWFVLAGSAHVYPAMAIDVSGDVSGTWAVGDSPVVVTADINPAPV